MPKQPTTSKVKESLDNRFRRVEIIQKIETIKADKLKAEQESQKRDLEIESQLIENEKLSKGLSYASPISELLNVAQSFVIEPTTYGSDLKLRNLFTDDELEIIKDKIFDKINKL